MKPGDLITHLDGVEVTAQNMNALFARFAMPRQRFDPRTGQPQAQEWSLSFRRGDEKTLNATLKVDSYSPESAFGVWKRADGKWDCLLDRQTKIGYIRLGSIELGLEKIFAEMMADLDKQGCRGLILDLRWCPGGYVDPGMHIAGQFLPDGCVISKMEFFHPERSGRNGDVLAAGWWEVRDPAARGDRRPRNHWRRGTDCLLRSATTIVVSSSASARWAAPASSGRSKPASAAWSSAFQSASSLRPNGKNRQRFPNSQPTDDWGIRPDEGWDVAATTDKSAELRLQADLHALRGAGSKEALPFDDPAQDPFRLAALKYLRSKLTPSK